MSVVDFQRCEYFSHFITNHKGELISVPLRRGNQDGAFIDWITVTWKEDSIILLDKYPYFERDEILKAYSLRFFQIFGFGIEEKMKTRGNYFYDEFYRLGSEKATYGYFHIGGQQAETVLLELNATGCQAALPDWEQRFYQFLQNVRKPHITRIDTTKDYFLGEYTPEKAYEDYKNGLFVVSNNNPKCQKKGTAWETEDFTGKTLTIGTPNSTKMLNVYEKGRQLKDKDSLWTRFEVRHKATKDNHLPLDMLIDAGSYLFGSYPLLNEVLFHGEVKRTNSTNKKLITTFESRRHYARQQVGKLVLYMRDIGWSAEDIIADLISECESGVYPKGLDLAEYNCEENTNAINKTYIHHQDEQEFALHDDPEAVRHISRIYRSLSEPAPLELKNDLAKWLKIRIESQEALHDQKQKIRKQQEADEFLDWIYINYGSLMNYSKATKK